MTASGTPENNKKVKGFSPKRKVKKPSKTFQKSYEEVYSETISKFNEMPERQHFVAADDPALTELVQLWGGNLYNPIRKPNISGEDWKTLKYALEPRLLQDLYHDPDVSVGLRFTGCTKVFVVDTDIFSSIHPETDEAKFRRMAGVLEGIGLCKYTTLQSSDSKGLHLMYTLPKYKPSRLLSLAAGVALHNAGFVIKNGTLEIFPNLKGWSADRVINYQGLRLPLQPNSGSYVLDNLDFEPLHNDLPTLIKQLHQDAQGQDMEALNRAMKVAYDDYYVTTEGQLQPFRRTNSRQKAAAFEADLKRVEDIGWTAYGQTNDLLPVFTKRSLIFLGLDGEALVKETAARMRSKPGYTQYCRHQHNLEERIRDWLKSIKALGYYKYCGEYHPRQGANYGDVVAATNAPPEDGRQHNAANAERQSAAGKKFFDTIRILTGDIRRGECQALPTSYRGWLDLIIEIAKEKFGQGFGKTYLHKFKRTIERVARWARWFIHRTAPVMLAVQQVEDAGSQGLTIDEEIINPVSPELPGFSLSSTLTLPPEPGVTTGDMETTGEEATPPPKNAETRSAPAVTSYFEEFSKTEEIENAETRPAPAVTSNLPIYGGGKHEKPPQAVQFPYRLGQQVKFRSDSFQGWRKGVVDWVEWQSGYFVNCLIRYKIFKTRSRYRPGQWEERTVKIFNVNWIESG